jgi:hypothetical protein
MNEGDPFWKIGGDALNWAWKNREELLKKINEWFKGQSSTESSTGENEASTPVRPGILIIGPGGVGKTTIARILAGDFDHILTETSGGYRESLNIEKFSLKDDPEIGIVVPPGQEHRRPSTGRSFIWRSHRENTVASFS